MRMIASLSCLALLSAVAMSVMFEIGEAGVCLEKVASTTDKQMFINMVALPESSTWMVAATQGGRIELWNMKNDGEKVWRRRKPILDISDRVHSEGERGLLGVALHHNFKDNGRMFVSYSCAGRKGCQKGSNVIEEYHVRHSSDLKTMVGSKERVGLVLYVKQPAPNHNGGQILFSSDRSDPHLYAMFGDGGRFGDPSGNSQNLNSLLGKILRLDISSRSKHGGYSIPADNPFVGVKGAKEEVYAFGLRNPWRCSFDRVLHHLICGDVGQDDIEEVNLIEAGGNFGWSKREGTKSFQGGKSPRDEILPILEYSHDFVGLGGPASVTGGYVYRPTKDSCLAGHYVFADYYERVFLGAPGPQGDMSMVAKPWKCSPDSPIPCSKKLTDIWTWGETGAGSLFLSCATGVYRLLEPSQCGLACP